MILFMEKNTVEGVGEHPFVASVSELERAAVGLFACGSESAAHSLRLQADSAEGNFVGILREDALQIVAGHLVLYNLRPGSAGGDAGFPIKSGLLNEAQICATLKDLPL